jgi:polyphenol oxidase
MNSLKLLQFKNLSAFQDLVHFQTTRVDGYSMGNYQSLNLALHVNDDREHVILNRKKLAEEANIPFSQMVFARQTHKTNVAIINSTTGRGYEFENEALPNTDALITKQKGICLMILTADCVPIVLYDPVQKAVGIVHAGWKGTVGKIITNTLDSMKEVFRCNPENIWAGVGASISPEQYEVGQEVEQAVLETFGTQEKFLIQNPTTKKYHLDLWYANTYLLKEAGIPQDQIENLGLCTFQDSENFFSARRDGVESGRMAMGVYLK